MSNEVVQEQNNEIFILYDGVSKTNIVLEADG
jgi:hypothetical protein